MMDDEVVEWKGKYIYGVLLGHGFDAAACVYGLDVDIRWIIKNEKREFRICSIVSALHGLFSCQWSE